MAKKTLLSEEEELISYQVVKNKKKQMILLDRRHKSGYLVHSQDLKKVKFFHQRFILSVFVYLMIYVVFNTGEFISLLVSLVVYGIVELIYRYLILNRFKKIKITDSEMETYDNHPEMINYLRSTCVTRILLYLSFLALSVLHLFSGAIILNDFIAAIVIVFACALLTVYTLVRYIQLTKKGKAIQKLS